MKGGQFVWWGGYPGQPVVYRETSATIVEKIKSESDEKITSVKPLPKAEKVKIGKWKWWWGYPGQPTRGWENNNKCEGRESESEKFKGKVMRRLTYFLRWSYYILCPICHLSWSILEKLTHPCCWRSVSLPMWVEMPSGGLVRIATMIMWVDVGFISAPQNRNDKSGQD